MRETFQKADVADHESSGQNTTDRDAVVTEGVRGSASSRREIIAGGLLFLVTNTVDLTGCNGFFISSHTSTTLTASATTVAADTSVVLTAKVATSAATGTVTFYNGSTELGTGTLTSGVATYTATSLPTGTDSVTAVYSGDDTYNGSTSAILVITVTAAALMETTTTLTVSSTSIQSGSSVTLTATLSSPTATGTVIFDNGTTSLGTGAVVAGIATLTTAALPVATDSLTAVYSGDTSFAASTSTAVEVEVT